jgi:hypothetical protein
LQDLPDRTPEDDEAIETLLKAMQGGAEAERQRSTLLNYVASLAHHSNHGLYGRVKILCP